MPRSTSSPRLSVVLPVRNGGRFLAAAVDSVLDQTFDDFELVLVDDHSSDGAIEALPQRDARVRVLPSRGRGVVAAFETGRRAARGAFIARMDADDLALADRFERQLSYLADHADVGIAGGCVEIFRAGGTQEGNQRYATWLNSLTTPDAIRTQLFVECPIPNPTAMFRASVLAELAGYRDSEWPEDYDLFLRADAAGVRMGKPDGVILRWRDHDERLTRRSERYSITSFQRAKAHHLVHGRTASRPVILWGAGPTGRSLHDLLVAEGGTVNGFIDVHPRRIGGTKRGLPVWPIDKVHEADLPLVLVAVGARNARDQIRAYMTDARKLEGTDYLFVS